MTDEPPEPTTFDKLRQEYGYELTTGPYDHEELDPPDWITDLDREICRLLGHGLVFTPSLLAKNLDRPRSSVSRRLNTLEAGNIVEKIERGHYKLTEEGYARMLETVSLDDLDFSDLDRDPPDGKNWITRRILSPEEVEQVESNG